MQVVIDTAQTRITVKDGCFYIVSPHHKRRIHPRRLSSIAVYANTLINSSAMMLAVDYQIPIFYFDRIGRIRARIMSPYFVSLASLRRKQLLVWGTPLATELAARQLLRKLAGQEILLNRLKYQRTNCREKLVTILGQVAVTRKKLEQVSYRPLEQARNSLMGIEGRFARMYWSGLSGCLDEPYRFGKRSRRPARDLFNAALNYLYGMTYTEVESAVFAAGLDPFIGYLHAENYRKPSLVFDLIEPFRPLVDGLLVQLFTDKAMLPEQVDARDGGFTLNREGKKILIPAFNGFMETRVKFNENVRSMRDHIFQYCSQFAKTINQFNHDVPDHL
ncbi:CRISPR-associated protein, Cas1 family [Cyclobacterium xiamenense]|uniref:CRISPR-associated endonuclease Cas1 n=1 Tax=Cyclobacterium xiamenense TaxID=1297121 RepID=A0A1H7BZZ5_9BACT|nr:CRISPR-associated endonuclease Cas1 [Cyclobacterium xiamenense]SEJ81917.1 CRISPR-associated protein, Cas1 family [Cyclobacterium xiamenense]